MLLTILNTAVFLTTLLVLLWIVNEYIRARREIRKLISLLHTKTSRKKMDDLLDGLVADETNVVQPASAAPAAVVQPAPAAAPQPTTVSEQRDRLAIIAAGGQARQYLGKSLSVEEIDKMGDDEVRKLYTRYETRLGVCMTKTLGKAVLQLYTTVATMFLPIPPENRQPLMEDLESDPFVDHALNSTACELYYRHGKLLALITAALTTAKYCQFGHQCPRRIEEDGIERQQCDSTGGVAPTGDNRAGAPARDLDGASASIDTTCFEGDGRDVTQPAV